MTVSKQVRQLAPQGRHWPVLKSRYSQWLRHCWQVVNTRRRQRRTFFSNIFLNYEFDDYQPSYKHYGQFFQNRKKIMSRRNYIIPSNKQNKYDQMTNLAIDLEGQLNRSVVFPKIVARMQDNELRDYVGRKKQQEEMMISQLKGEVDRLKRQVILMEDQKYVVSRMQTEGYDYLRLNPHDKIRSRVLLSHHIEDMQTNNRNSEDIATTRVQRNTDKTSRNNKGSKNSQVQIENMVMQKVGKSKGKRQSRIKIDLSKLGSSGSLLENGGKKKKHKSNPKARRRLRACIIAVYFSIFLPSYSRKIYHNKLIKFMALYPHEISKYYGKKDQVSTFKYQQSKIWITLEEQMNIMDEVQRNNLGNCLKDVEVLKQVKVHFHFLLNQTNSDNSSQKQMKDFMSYEQQLTSTGNVEFLMGHLVTIVQKMCDNFMQIIKKTDFVDKYWKTIAQGLLTGSFINNSRPKLLSRVVDSGIVRPHHSHQTLVVATQEVEIALLTFDVFCRIYAYRWLCKLHREKINKKYSTQNALVGNFLVTIFYLIGEMIIDDKIKKVIKTGNNLSGNFKVMNKKIRPIVPYTVKKKTKGVDTRTNRLISDPPLLDEASSVLPDNQETVEKIKNQMLDVGTELYFKLKQKMKEYAKQVKVSTFEEKFLIHSDKKRPENLLKYEQNDNSQEKGPKMRQQSLESKAGRASKVKMAIKLSKPKNN